MLERATGSVFAGYRIEHLIGRGGMGVVYLATQLALERLVALKLVAPELAADQTFRERFQRELKFVAKIDHPNVIPVYHAGDEHGVLFIAMRYVAGTDLRTLVARDGRLEPARALGIITQVAQALDAAHELGVVHRDVKPANVLIERRNGGDHVFLTDFGLSKHTTSGGGLTAPGQWVGTVDYIPPEQIFGQTLDSRTDVYALACVLYETLTGRVPFEKDGDAAKLWAHMNDPPPRLGAAADGLPHQLEEVVQRGMAKHPDDRYPTAGGLARAALYAMAQDAPTRIEGLSPDLAGQATRISGAPEAPSEVPSPPSVRSAPARPVEAAEPSSEQEDRPPPRERRIGGRRRLLLYAVVGLLVIGAVAAFLLAGGGGAGGPDSAETSTVTVGRAPTQIAAEGGAVWVINSGAGTVTRVDARSAEPGEPIAVDRNPIDIAAGEGGVWVADAFGRISRLDPASGRPDASPVALRFDPYAIAAGASAVWIANGLENSVSVLDPTLRALSGDPIPVGNTPEALAVGDGTIWVANRDSGTLSRITAATRRARARAIPVGRAPSAVAVGLGSVWVTDREDGTLTRVEPDRGRVIGNTPVGRGPVAVAVGAGSVWVVNGGDDNVSRVDPNTGRVAGDPIPVGPKPADVAVADGSVWVTNSGSNTLTRIAP